MELNITVGTHSLTQTQTDRPEEHKVYELTEFGFCFNTANLVVINQLSEALWILSISCLSF